MPSSTTSRPNLSVFRKVAELEHDLAMVFDQLVDLRGGQNRAPVTHLALAEKSFGVVRAFTEAAFLVASITALI